MKQTAAFEIQSRQLPHKLRIELIKQNLSFSEWCRRNGFSAQKAQNIASGITRHNEGEALRIWQTLNQDFPQAFK